MKLPDELVVLIPHLLEQLPYLLVILSVSQVLLIGFEGLRGVAVLEANPRDGVPDENLGKGLVRARVPVLGEVGFDGGDGLLGLPLV